MQSFSVRTPEREAMVDITRQVAGAMGRVSSGICQVFVTHTTAGVTINENADPDVPADMLAHLSAVVPRRADFRHGEGNSDAHIKSSLVGCSALVPVRGGAPVLGTWQAIFLCEFDGPRTRRVQIQCLAASEGRGA